MFRVIAVTTALAALAAAQSEFSASNGGINIETREGETATSDSAASAPTWNQNAGHKSHPTF